MTHHPIIEKDVDELLAKGAIEPTTGVLPFAQICLLFLTALMVYNP